jgi:hypothetical protein
MHVEMLRYALLIRAPDVSTAHETSLGSRSPAERRDLGLELFHSSLQRFPILAQLHDGAQIVSLVRARSEIVDVLSELLWQCVDLLGCGVADSISSRVGDRSSRCARRVALRHLPCPWSSTSIRPEGDSSIRSHWRHCPHAEENRNLGRPRRGGSSSETAAQSKGPPKKPN